MKVKIKVVKILVNIAGNRVINEKDLVEKKSYIIDSVEDFLSPDKQKGLKVVCHSTDKSDKQKYATILWTRDEVGLNSKLGAFVSAFAEMDNETGIFKDTNTDSWVNETFTVVSWQPKNRKIIAK